MKQQDIKTTLNRRTLLLTAFFVSFGALVLKMSTVIFSFLRPPIKKNSYGGIINLGNINELPIKNSAPKHFPEGRFWLIHDDQGVSALHSSCTHLDCLFTWDSEKQLFVCPCHGSTFTKEGEVLNGPATRSLDKFPVIIVDENNQPVRTAPPNTADPVTVDDILKQNSQAENSQNTESTPKVLLVQVDTGQKIITSEKSY